MVVGCSFRVFSFFFHSLSIFFVRLESGQIHKMMRVQTFQRLNKMCTHNFCLAHFLLSATCVRFIVSDSHRTITNTLLICDIFYSQQFAEIFFSVKRQTRQEKAKKRRQRDTDYQHCAIRSTNSHLCFPFLKRTSTNSD